MGKRMRGFFITGTGTDIGKTFVARLLAEGISKTMPVSYMKPVQTGSKKGGNGQLAAPDFDAVKKCRVLVLGPDELHVPYRFLPACSPHLAARLARVKISLAKIKACCDRIGRLPGMTSGCVLVEGAGGVLAPLGPSVSTIHLIMKLRLPVILVTTPELGTLNTTFLSLCALASTEIPVAGIVINNKSDCPKDFIYRDNVREIRAQLKVPVLETGYGVGCTKNVVEFCNELLA